MSLMVGLLALGGCQVGPDFRRPDAPEDQIYTNETLEELGAGHDQQLGMGTSVGTNWWSAFASPTLDATIKAALNGSQSLASATATLAQSEEQANARAGSLYPELALDAGAGRNKYGAAFLGNEKLPPFTYYSIGPAVSYALDYTGGNRRAVEQQRALAEFQRHALEAAYLSLTGNVTLEVLQIASLRAQDDSLRITLDQDAQSAALARAAFDAGSGTRVDLLNAQSQLANDQTQVPALHQQLSVAQHALAVLLGRSPAQWSAPVFDLDAFTLPADLPVSLPSELVRNRPDILAAEAQLHAAMAGVGVASANLYPQIVLTASTPQQALRPEHLFEASSSTLSLAAQLTEPIFDGGTLRAERRAAQDALRAATANYQQTVLQALAQVANALSELDHDTEQLTAQKRALDISQASLSLTRESYRAGNVGVIQILDAERLYQQAQLGYTRARAQRFVDTANLYLAVGTGNLSDMQRIAATASTNRP